jgi:hypothetical protein
MSERTSILILDVSSRLSDICPIPSATDTLLMVCALRVHAIYLLPSCLATTFRFFWEWRRLHCNIRTELFTFRVACYLCLQDYPNRLSCKRKEENQLDATECFIALIICSTCFGHLYDHHQEFETILVLLLHMVCNVLVVGGRLLGAQKQAMCPGWGKLCDSVAQFPSSQTLSLLLCS